MVKIFKCPKCGAFQYVTVSDVSVYARPQCDCGERMKTIEERMKQYGS